MARHFKTKTAQKRPVKSVILLVLLVVAALATIVWDKVNSVPTMMGTPQAREEVTAETTAEPTTEPEGVQAPTDDGGADVTQEPVTIDLMMIGDILLHSEVVSTAYDSSTGTYDFDFVFNDIRDEISSADVAILNQETACGYPSLGYGYLRMGLQGPIFNSPVSIVDSEAHAGFDLVLKATNHTFDQGYEGLSFELDYWGENYPEIPVIGVDNPNSPNGDQDYVDNIYVYEKDGFRVAFLNYTYDTNEYPNPETDGSYLCFLDEERIRSDVASARLAGADMIVACPHWGIQYTTEHSAEEERYSALFCELGVDVVFGTHPHIDQNVEVLESDDGHITVCFYSNGNFVAGDMEGVRSIAGISCATLSKQPDGTCSVTAAAFIPTIIHRGSSIAVYKVANYTDELAASSLDPELTPSFINQWCGDLLGEGYDVESSTYTVDLTNTVDAEEKAANASYALSYD